MVASLWTDEDGFSLSELIVVLALIGVVLAATYGALDVVNKSSDVSDRQALFAREISTPLNAMEEVLSQAIDVRSIGDYSVTVTTDADHDDRVEIHTITATADGRVTHQAWNTNALRQQVFPAYFDVLWSEHNTNQADNEPAFVFFDSSNTAMDPATDDEDDARTVQVTFSVEYDGRAYSDSRMIFMRNRRGL